MLRLHDLCARGLEPVSLEVQDGTCLALYGPSGAGKTMLLRAIADLDENTGDVETAYVARSSVAAPVWRRAVTYVPAESGWWTDHVGDHVPNTAHCHDLLARLGLPQKCLSWDVSRLSTGERHRLALIRALLQNPEVLLLDEPTAALDAAATEQVESVLKDTLSDGMTIVLVSHEKDQAARLNAAVAQIEDGCVRITAEESPS